MKPVHKRTYQVFMSHSWSDKQIVSQVNDWLLKSGLKTFYDSYAIVPGSQFVDVLQRALPESRAFLLFVSQASLASGYVNEEYQVALDEEINYKKRYGDRGFRLIPVLLEDVPNSDLPTFLKTRLYHKMDDGQLTLDFADRLFYALYQRDDFSHMDIEEEGRLRDVYVAATWQSQKDHERVPAQRAMRAFINAGFRLIGDAPDQDHFGGREHRVENIVQSCGWLLAILPYRADKPESGFTSSYMLEEIEFAYKHNLPYVLLAETQVEIPEQLERGAQTVQRFAASNLDTYNEMLDDVVQVMREAWKMPTRSHYVFFATNFSDLERNERIRRLVQMVTGMRCFIANELTPVPGLSPQQQVVDMIANAHLLIADITDDNPNTLVETGIARGAGVYFRLVKRGERHRPVYMLRDNEPLFYDTDAELLARIHKIAYAHRRRVINFEMEPEG